MNFILIQKKNSFKNEDINEEFLNSPKAPSLISRESVRLEINNFILYIYPYNQIDNEIYGHSYYSDDKRLLLINGIVNIDDESRDFDITNFFDQLNDTSELLGDYQIFSIDSNGNGVFKTPQLSIRQLFLYEDENCKVLSTEIKLIVDSLKKFRRDTFVNNFDLDFIEDAIFREWKTRYAPRNTIFKDIKRILPQDIKYFSEGKIVIERKSSIEIPDWFREAYYTDKAKLYDDYVDKLTKFVETNLISLKSNIEVISLGLSGGLDSRLSVSILSKLTEKHQIPFECVTSGYPDHPDVIIANKITEMLQVEHVHQIPLGDKEVSSKKYEDYFKNFYVAQGDFNSKNLVVYYSRNMIDPNRLSLIGLDAYKRITIDQMISANRWYARILLCMHNFFFPLFFMEYDMWFGMIHGEIGENTHYEFAYEILKRSEPKLLTIPLVGDQIPQINVKPYSTTEDSKFHEKEPFLWDYDLVKENLKPIFEKKFNKLSKKCRLILDLVGLDEFDYFYDQEFQKQINLFEEKGIDSKEFREYIIKKRLTENYPKSKSMIEFTKEDLYNPYINGLQILMDFAVVAKENSFVDIEKIWNEDQ